MMTDDGRGFSDGQKQLISIARAAITNAPVLVLDEATSFVDSNTEAAIRDGIKNLMKGKTTFIVAHKLSTVENVDLILFLKDGRIAESGTHEQLIEKRGLYYELYHFI
jgi:ATP-binding cassette subfamily B protein